MLRRHVRQVDLADAIGIGRAALSRRLCGAVPFDLNELEAIARHFDLEPADLLRPAWDPIRQSPCLHGSDEPDSPIGAKLRHPTGLASLEAEIGHLLEVQPVPATK